MSLHKESRAGRLGGYRGGARTRYQAGMEGEWGMTAEQAGLREERGGGGEQGQQSMQVSKGKRDMTAEQRGRQGCYRAAEQKDGI